MQLRGAKRRRSRSYCWRVDTAYFMEVCGCAGLTLSLAAERSSLKLAVDASARSVTYEVFLVAPYVALQLCSLSAAWCGRACLACVRQTTTETLFADAAASFPQRDLAVAALLDVCHTSMVLGTASRLPGSLVVLLPHAALVSRGPAALALVAAALVALVPRIDGWPTLLAACVYALAAAPAHLSAGLKEAALQAHAAPASYVHLSSALAAWQLAAALALLAPTYWMIGALPGRQNDAATASILAAWAAVFDVAHRRPPLFFFAHLFAGAAARRAPETAIRLGSHALVALAVALSLPLGVLVLVLLDPNETPLLVACDIFATLAGLVAFALHGRAALGPTRSFITVNKAATTSPACSPAPVSSVPDAGDGSTASLLKNVDDDDAVLPT